MQVDNPLGGCSLEPRHAMKLTDTRQADITYVQAYRVTLHFHTKSRS